MNERINENGDIELEDWPPLAWAVSDWYAYQNFLRAALLA